MQLRYGWGYPAPRAERAIAVVGFDAVAFGFALAVIHSTWISSTLDSFRLGFISNFDSFDLDSFDSAAESETVDRRSFAEQHVLIRGAGL